MVSVRQNLSAAHLLGLRSPRRHCLLLSSSDTGIQSDDEGLYEAPAPRSGRSAPHWWG